jgi:phage RecT family recombinase
MAQTRQMNAIAEVRLQLDNMLGQFAAVLPKHITAERFGRVVLTAIQNNPELLECDRRSMWNAAMRAANDGLLPDGRLGAIVVYKDKKRGTKQAQWLPMIAGLRQKVRNSGEIATWEANVVHERDQWEYEQGDSPHIFHRPVRGDRGPVIAAYSIAKLKTGELSREWMWIEELNEARKVSRAERGPWQDWPDEMYRKTVARRHAKVLPMSSDLDDLLRRPDEPDDGDDEERLRPAERSGDGRLASMTDALDMIVTTSGERVGSGAAAGHREPSKASKLADALLDEIDKTTGGLCDPRSPVTIERDDEGLEPVDYGEYADSDDELPLGEKDHKHEHDRA